MNTLKTTEAKIFFSMMPLMLIWFGYLVWFVRVVEAITPIGGTPFFFIGSLPLWMNGLMLLLSLAWGLPLLVFLSGRLVATAIHLHRGESREKTSDKKA